MGITVFTDPNQLRGVTDRIHDRWFDSAEITFNENKATLTIPFFDRTVQAPGFRSFEKVESVRPFGFLKIYHVASYTIRDTEKVGLYDFNKFTYDARKKRLLMHTGVPIEIEITVTQFELALEELPYESTDTTT